MRTPKKEVFSGVCMALFVHPPGDYCHPVSKEECPARVSSTVEVIVGFFRVTAEGNYHPEGPVIEPYST